MNVLFALLAAGLYGAADFYGGLGTKRASMWAVTIASQGAGWLVLLAVVRLVPGSPVASDYWWGAAAGLVGCIGLALLYHALAIGKMGIVSPITAALGASFPVVAGVFRGERLSALEAAGIALALLAVVMISASHEESGELELRTRGVKEAIVSGCFLGALYILLAKAGPHAGLYPLLTARLASMAMLTAIALGLRQSVVPAKASLPYVAAAGILDMSANVFYLLATFHGLVSIAAVLTSLYPASTVLLAWGVLRERLRPVQYAGMLCALAGVVLIGL